MIEIEIPGKPVALKRARTSKGKFYDPSAKDKARIQWFLRKQFNRNVMTGPVSLGAVFYFTPSKSTPKGKRDLMIQYSFAKFSKPDIDNLLKMILDCGNKILWCDDAQIFEILTLKKVYSEKEMTKIFFDEN